MNDHILNSASETTKQSAYVPLHVLSDYSIGKSIAKIDRLVEKAKSLNMKALALTDWDLSAAIRFHLQCLWSGIKPIIGQKIAFGGGHALVYCKDAEAYKILCRHSIELQDWAGAKNRLPFTEAECRHFICVTSEPDIAYLKNFADDVYVEAQAWQLKDKTLSQKTLSLISDRKAVVTNEVNFIEKEDAEIFDLYKRVLPDASEEACNPENYFKSGAEIAAVLKDCGRLDLLANTEKIAGQCIFPEDYFTDAASYKRMMKTVPQPTLPDGCVFLPDYFVNAGSYKRKAETVPAPTLPDGFNDIEEYFKAEVRKGIEARYGVNPSEAVLERAEFEIDEIISRGRTKCVLFYHALASWCKEQDIMYGRTAIDSIVNYALGVTDVNPLRFGLTSERFLNQKIPTDFPNFYIYCTSDDGRDDDVAQYLKAAYGENNVARISSFSHVRKARWTLRLACEALRAPTKKMEEIDTMLPLDSPITLENLFAEDYEEYSESETAKIKKFFEDKSNEKLIKTAFAFEWLVYSKIRESPSYPSHYIVTQKPLCEYAPVYKDSDGEIVCCYTQDLAAYVGLMKINIHEYGMLTFYKNVEKAIRKRDGDFSLDAIPYEDEETLRLIQNADTENVFHFESPEVRKILKRFKPKKFSDLFALSTRRSISNFAKLIDEKGKPDTTTLAGFDEILGETFGIPLYQEQIMEITQKVTGCSLASADLLMRDMRRRDSTVPAEKKKDFVAAAVKNGYGGPQAKHIFHALTRFAEYAADKSRAVESVKLAWQSTYLKAHYPKEFAEEKKKMDAKRER